MRSVQNNSILLKKQTFLSDMTHTHTHTHTHYNTVLHTDEVDSKQLNLAEKTNFSLRHDTHTHTHTHTLQHSLTH